MLVIGGGIAGTSLIHLLAKRGFDAVLVERSHLAAGASGRLAGHFEAPCGRALRGHDMDHSEVLEKQGNSALNRPWRRVGDCKSGRNQMPADVLR